MTQRIRRLHAGLAGAAILAMLAAMWAGWIRLGWSWPAIQANLPANHGPLMVGGFLGTLISLERAVAVKKWWAYLAPIFSALGGFALICFSVIPRAEPEGMLFSQKPVPIPDQVGTGFFQIMHCRPETPWC